MTSAVNNDCVPAYIFNGDPDGLASPKRCSSTEKPHSSAVTALNSSGQALVTIIPAKQFAASHSSKEIKFSNLSAIAAAISAAGDDSTYIETLIATLRDDTAFKDLFINSPNQAEVFQQTRHLLINALQQRHLFDSMNHQHVNWREFLLFLALKGLGKMVARERESETSDTPINIKVRELQMSQTLLRCAMMLIGIDEQKIAFFSALATYDSLGLYCSGLIGKKEVIDNLEELSFATNVSMRDLFDTLKLVHSIETASFSENSPPSNPIEKLVKEVLGHIRLVEEGEIVFNRLYKRARKIEKHEETVSSSLFDYGKQLYHYLRFVHGKMLMDISASSENKKFYRKIRRHFRRILRTARKESDVKNSRVKYEKALRKSGGRREMNTYGVLTLLSSFRLIKSSADTYSRHYISALFDELVNFRKDFKTRYSKDKLANFITQESASLVEKGKIKTSSPVKPNQDNMNLMQLTFIHGSNSSILPNLPLTDMHLIASGRLFKMGIVPLSGELDAGLGYNGINQYMISGTSLDNGERALGCAEASRDYPSFAECCEGIKMLIQNYNEGREKNIPFFEDLDSAMDNIYTPILRVVIPRMRATNQKVFSEFAPQLMELFRFMEADFNRFKDTKSYRKHMPKEEDKDGTLGYKWHDYYYFHHFQNTEYGIQELKRVTEAPIYVPDGIMEATQKVFPLVFGSTTLNPETHEPANPSERCSVKAAKLGKDLQYIFSNKEDMELVSAYLKDHGLESAVKVMDRSLLEQAIILNRIAAPYLCDIAHSETKKRSGLKN